MARKQDKIRKLMIELDQEGSEKPSSSSLSSPSSLEISEKAKPTKNPIITPIETPDKKIISENKKTDKKKPSKLAKIVKKL